MPPDTLQNPDVDKSSRFSPATILIGAIVMVAIALSVWFLLKPPADPGAIVLQTTVPLKMGTAELEYAKNIKVENLALSRAENFLHQEVTTLAGEVVNGGSQSLLGVMLTIEFHDSMNQIVLRETRSVLGVRATALAPGEHRPFEIAFDNIPASWNMQQPTLRVARLQLANTK
jgi:hypothetical protein